MKSNSVQGLVLEQYGEVLQDCLTRADGDVGLAFACYDGGSSVITRNQKSWADETQRYYRWSVGIYVDAVRGHQHGDTLDEWLMSLCESAAETILR